MITKKQLKILEPFTKEAFREYAIKEIKSKSNEKSNNSIHLGLKKFKEENLVKERLIGKSKLYTLNLEENKIFYYIGLINSEKLPKSAQKTISLIKAETEKYTSFFSIVVFGSYSIGEQKKDSDLDIAVFIENEETKKKVQLALNSAKLKSVIKIDPHAISQEEFLEMLKVDYANLGKEIARKHLSIYNPQIFYSLLNKGVKNGFNL